MGIETVKAPKERQPGPFPANRRCDSCNCFLSRQNPSSLCAPCNRGEWSIEAPNDIWAGVAKMKPYDRAEVIGELMGAEAA